MLTPAPFYFIRHGETDWNKQRLMQGQTDTPLNAVGVEQARAAAEFLAGQKITTICVSPLRRAQQTAEIIAARCSVTSIVSVPGLKESNFGIYEGQPSGPWRDAWAAGAELPGGENYEEFLRRSRAALNECLQNPGPVLVVAHGGTFYAARRWALAGAEIKTANCEVLALSPPLPDSQHPWTAERIFAPTSL